ncbi:MAG: hypothetical protein ACKO96_42540, partial [Flammeovirgaceae bacterium]
FHPSNHFPIAALFNLEIVSLILEFDLHFLENQLLINIFSFHFLKLIAHQGHFYFLECFNGKINFSLKINHLFQNLKMS